MNGHEKKLHSILKPHDNWWNDGGADGNLAARAALLDFYRELRKLKPAQEYVPGNVFHTSHIRGLLAVKIALVEGRYMRACNEIISLMAYQPLLQGRVYYSLVKVLQEELVRGQGGSG